MKIGRSARREYRWYNRKEFKDRDSRCQSFRGLAFFFLSGSVRSKL
jgi:hypothetical protein